MSNIPTPGLLRSIKDLSDQDLKLKVRTAGIVIDRSEGGSSIVLKSNLSCLIVDCTIPMANNSLSNHLPHVTDRLTVLGYIRLATDEETSRHKSFESKYSLDALIIKHMPGLNLAAWEESIELN
ncbi:hypothetical protein VP01_1600g2 [Puccinia sorghi]|uniref:Uncharacterized protein n=1 Tax=Puccinia sorghi TaxID=27349 RepID=A0A0L6VHV8_9BASI|nr:hypothetical protein VP01_1600g2 [Puccinia sorghi]